MLFTQPEFLFVFLPGTLTGYFLLRVLFRESILPLAWLATASLVFYSQWNINFLPIIGASILANYGFGILLHRLPERPAARHITFVIVITANIAALAFFKYSNFLIESFDNSIGITFHPLPIELPLGISFFTFTQIAYLVDVYRRRAFEAGLVKYTLFVSYFPHLIAGPILHHSEMMPQFDKAGATRFSPERMALGITLFAIGLCKKVMIADSFALIANPVFKAAAAGGVVPIDAWGGALGYSLQIYFDFSGYCDMALGLSLMFGIVLPFNFDAPYKARSIAEFWRRWHITLSRFLRDYLYIPLGGNRAGAARRNLNLLITMLLGGLWHGAGWTYIVWGALHGVFLVINHGWSRIVRHVPGLRRVTTTLPYLASALVLTQLCVVVAWIFFRANSLDAAQRMVGALVGFSGAAAGGYKPTVTMAHLAVIALAYLACIALPNVNELFGAWHVGLDTYANPRPWSVMRLTWRPSMSWAVGASMLLMAGIFATLVAGDGSQFLYFQF